MSTEFDIDTPADMELLGGEQEQEPEQEENLEQEAEQDQEKLAASGQDEDDGAEEEQAQPPKRDQVIPRARFDEVNAKLHAAREEAEQLRAALAAKQEQEPASVDLDDLEDRFYDALLLDDREEAKKIRAQINADMFARAEAASINAVSRQLAERAEESQFQQIAKQAIEVFPFLDIESSAANNDAINDVLSWRGMYESQGHSRANALAMAVNKVAPHYHRTAPAEEDPPVDTRKQKAMRLAAETANLQPPRVDDGVGTRAIPVSREILGNQDKWDRASESERMRFLQ